MTTAIFVRGLMGGELKRHVQDYARAMLGRLRRHVTHAELLLDESEPESGKSAHQCTLRLRLSAGSDVLVHARGAGRDAALSSAFRQARRALLRRRRAALRLTPWRKPPQPVAA